MGRPDVLHWMCHFLSCCRERIHYDLSSCGSGTSPGSKRQLIRGWGSAARISNGTGPQDPSGGETQLTAPREQPNPRLVVERSDEVEVATLVVEAIRGGWIGSNLPSQIVFLW